MSLSFPYTHIYALYRPIQAPLHLSSLCTYVTASNELPALMTP